MKFRFNIHTLRLTNIEKEPYVKIKKNFECIINAAMMSEEYNHHSTAYKLLGANYETVFNHLKSTVKNYDHRRRYIIGKKVNRCMTLEDVIKSYHYTNLKLEIDLLDK